MGGEQHTGGAHGSCHLEAPPVPDERFALGGRRWSAAKSLRLIARTRLTRIATGLLNSGGLSAAFVVRQISLFDRLDHFVADPFQVGSSMRL